jgi:hypothetical protein
MHHVEDFRYILPQHFDLLATAHARMSRNDYLLATALLTAGGGSRINNDQSIVDIAFDQFRIGAGYAPDDLPTTQDYYTRYDIHLGDHLVAWWQTRHKFYPFEQLRVWLNVEKHAEQVICELLGTAQKAVGGPASVPPPGQGGAARPRVTVVLHERDVL